MAIQGQKCWALLVGINTYHSITCSPLRGCTQDVDDIAQLLKIYHKAIDIQTVTSTDEETLALPDYDVVTKALQHIDTNAQPGDFIYIHFSGHGAQQWAAAKNTAPTAAEKRSLYEVLMLDGNRHLKDYEIGRYLDRLSDKGRILFVVLDCCHSGGAERSSGDDAVRGFDGILPPPEEGEECRHDEKKTTENGSVSQDGDLSRDGSTHQCYWLRPRNYTVLTACEPSQKAVESTRGGKTNGLLTRLMIESVVRFAARGKRPTYRALHHDILASMRAEGASQVCMLLGLQDRALLDNRSIADGVGAAPWPATVSKVTASQVEIDVGLVHGVRAGEEYAVYRRDAMAGEAHHERPVAIIKVHDAGPLSSRADWSAASTTMEGGIAIEVGCPAKLLTPVITNPLHLRIPSPDLRAAVTREIANTPLGPLGVEISDGPGGSGGDDCTHQVLISEDGCYRVTDSAGTPLRNLAAMPDNDNLAAEVLARVQTVARYRFVDELFNKTSRLDQSFSFQIADGSAAEVFEGERVVLEFANLTKPPNSRPLYFNLFDLQPGWAIEHQLPTFEVQPQTGSIKPVLTMSIPHDIEGNVVQDHYVMIVTTKPVSLSGLATGERSAQNNRCDADNLSGAFNALTTVMQLNSTRHGTLELVLKDGDSSIGDTYRGDDWQAARVTITTKKRGSCT